MGYSVNGKCVETVSDALISHCSTFPQTELVNQNIYTHSCLSINETNQTLQMAIQTNGTATLNYINISPKFSACTEITTPSTEPDFGISAIYFSTALISTMILFLFAKGIGSVFKMLDKHIK